MYHWRLGKERKVRVAERLFQQHPIWPLSWHISLYVYKTDGTLRDRMFRIHVCRCAMNSACTIEDWERGEKVRVAERLCKFIPRASIWPLSWHIALSCPLSKTVRIEFSEYFFGAYAMLSLGTNVPWIAEWVYIYDVTMCHKKRRRDSRCSKQNIWVPLGCYNTCALVSQPLGQNQL